jgi:hypothetical protein
MESARYKVSGKSLQWKARYSRKGRLRPAVTFVNYIPTSQPVKQYMTFYVSGERIYQTEEIWQYAYMT